MATYLVTGAAGFIASKVCEQLLASGHTVVGIDNLNDYYDVRLKDYRLAQLLGKHDWAARAHSHVSQFQGASASCGKFYFRALDIEKIDHLDSVFADFKFDGVFNLAARAGVRYSLVNPHVYLSTNTLGALNVLECQRKHGVKKHVLASTSSLYAGCSMPFKEHLPVNAPLSPYAATKKAAELLAYTYHHLYGLDITVVRYFTVFGPAGRPDMSVFRFIKWIDEGVPLELFGDGTQSRDFTYVDDVAHGTILAARSLGYEIINLGGGRNPMTLLAMISLIEKSLGKTAIINIKPFHNADLKQTWADIAKAGSLLGWKPLVGPEVGFQHSVDWFRANRGWLADVKT